MSAQDTLSPAPRPWGVNVVGYLEGELGVGEAARQIISALDARRIPVAPIRRGLADTRTEHFFPHASAPRHGPFAVNLICENAVSTPRCAEVMGEHFFEDRYTVGLWFWEVSTFPDRWDAAFAHLEEVWVASEHVAEAVRARSPIPVTKIRLPVSPIGVAAHERSALGLPDGFCFLLVFDYNSVLERKNPLGLIEAFREAFPPGSGASLVLKTINAEKHPAARERLRTAAEEHPDVHLLERFASPKEKNAIIAACDCSVSLHRSEGFGLTLAEAMYFGKPVIATRYSGNLEFMTEENSYLVDHELRPIGPGADPYPPEGEWAEPDLEQAAGLMREVFERPEEARTRARRGADDIRRLHSTAAAGEVIERELQRIRELPRRRPPSARGPGPDRQPAPPDCQPAPLHRARERLAEGPEARSEQKPLRALLRSLLLRFLRPYAVHQEIVDYELTDAIEELHARQERSLEALAVRMERALEEIELRSQTDWAMALAALRRLERALESAALGSTDGVDAPDRGG